MCSGDKNSLEEKTVNIGRKLHRYGNVDRLWSRFKQAYIDVLIAKSSNFIESNGMAEKTKQDKYGENDPKRYRIIVEGKISTCLINPLP